MRGLASQDYFSMGGSKSYPRASRPCPKPSIRSRSITLKSNLINVLQREYHHRVLKGFSATREGLASVKFLRL